VSTKQSSVKPMGIVRFLKERKKHQSRCCGKKSSTNRSQVGDCGTTRHCQKG